MLFAIAHTVAQPNSSPSVLSFSEALSTIIAPANRSVEYESYRLDSSVVHTVLIPGGSSFEVTVAIAPQLELLQTFAQQYDAIAVLNGGFFDPVNQQSTSYSIINEELIADPQTNERLTANPDLAPYMDKILNRTEFRRYQCGQTRRYDITLHRNPTPVGCQLLDALGGGPRLLPTLDLEQEGFLDTQDGIVIRDPLGSDRPNARSAIGITADGDVIWVMVAQTAEDAPDAGLSLAALADFMKTLGVERAMNLDGGSSSSLYIQGETHYGKVNDAGNRVIRPVKTVLLVPECCPR